MADDEGAQEDELLALESIYDDERTFFRSPNEKGGQLNIFLEVTDNFLLKVRSAHVSSSMKSKATILDDENGFICLPVKYLPPIVLNFELPKGYPSSEPPSFTLSCKWLTVFQLSKLCNHLDKLWEEQGHMEIIYTWESSIKEDALTLLKIQSPFELHFSRNKSKPSTKKPPTDKRAIQDIGSYSLMVSNIMNYNEVETERVFNATYFECQVCYIEKIGSTCMKFYDCNHVYCCDCLSEYFTVQIKDGAVKNLSCPTPKCESQAFPSQVKSLVSADLYDKYDKFLLQTTLDSMSDTEYCPRPNCQTPVLIETESTIGECPKCTHVFCILCKKASHGVAPCSIKSTEFRKLKDEYDQASEGERLLLEKKYGRRILKHVFEEVVSDEWVKANSKKCPKCGCSIQKIEGCNKMTCSKCRSHFCWICNKLLTNGNPYFHFNNPSEECFNRLFEGVDGLNDEDDDDDDDDFDDYWLFVQ